MGIINAIPDIHRVLIICPASIKMNWYRECKKWLVRPFTIGIVDGKCFPSTDIAIVNYDLVHKYPKRLSFYWDLVVLDEAHRVKSPTARCTKAIVGYRASKKEQARGIVSTSGIPARRRLALTGTPIENRPAEIWTVLNYLDPQTWGNKWAFYKRYCDAKNNGFGFDIRGASNLSELQAKLRGSILIRRLKRDVMQDLPPITRMLVELEVDGADAAIAAERDTWNRHEADMVRMQAEMELAKVSDNEAAFKQAIERFRRESSAAFTEIARVRRETAMVKLPAAIEAINEDCGDGAGKCLVFAHHLDALHALKAAWGSEAVMVTGETLLPDRDKAVQRFQNDPSCTKFVGSIRATGEGLNLQAASVVYFVEEDWNPSKLSQCEARAHRYGQRDNVLVKHLLLAGSLDARMIGTIVDKQAIIDRALDDEKAVLVGEPVLVPKAPQNGSRKHLEDDGLLITSEQCRAILRGLQMLSGVCDGALKLDGAGFNKVDQRVGHELAQQNWLSPRQASLGRVLLKRYRKQLPQDVFDTIG